MPTREGLGAVPSESALARAQTGASFSHRELSSLQTLSSWGLEFAFPPQWSKHFGGGQPYCRRGFFDHKAFADAPAVLKQN